MTSHTPSSNLPRESWGRLIGTLLLLLPVIGAIVYGGFVLGIALGWIIISL